MNRIERSPQFKAGPRFFRAEDGQDMFEHRIDSRACIGPRVATKRDKEINPDLWAEYLAQWTAEEDRKIKRRAKG
jgi:hypothetical protein